MIKNSVRARSAESQSMVEKAAIGRALMGGTKTMRDADTTYLPKFKAETKPAYEERKSLSWLFNGYKKTVRDMTGRVFEKPMTIVSAPPNLKEWAENIDLDGRDLSTFARMVFEDGMAGSGVSYIMVDAPIRNNDELVSVEQAQSQNLRPYLIHLRVVPIVLWLRICHHIHLLLLLLWMTMWK